MTPDEIRGRLAEQGHRVSRSAIWRLLQDEEFGWKGNREHADRRECDGGRATGKELFDPSQRPRVRGGTGLIAASGRKGIAAPCSPPGSQDQNPTDYRLMPTDEHWANILPFFPGSRGKPGGDDPRVVRNIIHDFRKHAAARKKARINPVNHSPMLTEVRLAILLAFRPQPRGVPRDDDLRVASGIFYVFRRGLPWHAAPPEYGPYKTPCSRWRRRSGMGLFARMPEAPAGRHAETDRVMMDSTCFKASRTACGLGLKKSAGDRKVGMTRGRRNCKGHFPADARGRQMRVHLTAGQTSDCKGSDALLQNLPEAKVPVADRGCDANRIRNRLRGKGIKPCIPPRRRRKVKIKYSRKVHESRHRIEISIGRLKDWRRPAYRRDRCSEIFHSACCLAAIIIFRQ